MEYKIYKLSFKTPVHFGTGVLNESGINFCADTLFSALYIEAMKLGLADELLELAKNGSLLLSDAFPYIENTYFLPKPMVYIEPKEEGDSKIKKQYKKIKYIPVEEIKNFLSGNLSVEKCDLRDLGKEYSQVMAAVRREDETLPFRVGNFLFADGAGLYVIAALENENAQYILEDIFDSLSYAGIGGKRSSGKGKFEFKIGTRSTILQNMLTENTGLSMLISAALPKEEEMEKSLANASYLLQKRSGFVYSEQYADEPMKKRDLYTLQAGSCVTHRFTGDIYDVNEGGSHAVYRYAKGMFLGV